MSPFLFFPLKLQKSRRRHKDVKQDLCWHRRAGRERGWSHRKESFTALRPLMRKLTLILNQNWVFWGRRFWECVWTLKSGEGVGKWRSRGRGAGPCPASPLKGTKQGPARPRSAAALPCGAARASPRRGSLVPAARLARPCGRGFFAFITGFFNQHALSDSFIIVFNSLESLFALEERIKK